MTDLYTYFIKDNLLICDSVITNPSLFLFNVTHAIRWVYNQFKNIHHYRRHTLTTFDS